MPPTRSAAPTCENRTGGIGGKSKREIIEQRGCGAPAKERSWGGGVILQAATER